MSADPAHIPPPGVTVFCDPTLAPALRGFDPLARAQAGAPVAVLSAPAPSLLAQIARHARNDVLFTRSTVMDQAAAAGFVVPATRRDGFANALVLAVPAGRKAVPEAELARFLAGATLALTDDTPASGLDGRAVLAANGLEAGHVQGMASTADAAFLVITGAAEAALLYRSDVAAEPRLAALAELKADPMLAAYSLAVNTHAVSPNARALAGIIASQGGAALLRQSGLMVAA